MRSLERGLTAIESPALEHYPLDKGDPVSGHLLFRGADPNEWRGFPPDDLRGFVPYIGNLILRPAGREAGPPSDQERLAWACRLGHQINRDLERYESWTPDAVRHRQQDLAALALRVWPRDLKQAD